MENLEAELKQLIIDTFLLEGTSVSDIDAEAPLFDGGLGLDSIDALELGMALKKTYNIHIDTNSPDIERYFSSVKDLACFVVSQQNRNPL